MKTRKSSHSISWNAFLLICLVLIPGGAQAFGETFRIETSGTEYCGDLDSTKFSARDAVPLWVRLDSATQITVSLTSTFTSGTTFPMVGRYYLKDGRSAELIAGVLFEDDSYASIEANAKFDSRTGVATQLSGVFIQNSVIHAGCFSSGKFKSAR